MYAKTISTLNITLVYEQNTATSQCINGTTPTKCCFNCPYKELIII